MKMINELTLKNMKFNKKRTTITIVSGVLVSVLMFSLGLLARKNMNRNKKRYRTTIIATKKIKKAKIIDMLRNENI